MVEINNIPAMKLKAELVKKYETNPSEELEKEIEAKVLAKYNIKELLKTDNAEIAPGVGTDAEFVKKFGMGEIPATKENIERYQKIRNTY